MYATMNLGVPGLRLAGTRIFFENVVVLHRDVPIPGRSGSPHAEYYQRETLFVRAGEPVPDRPPVVFPHPAALPEPRVRRGVGAGGGGGAAEGVVEIR